MSETDWTPQPVRLTRLADETRAGWPSFCGALSAPSTDLLLLYALVVRQRPRVLVETGTAGGYSAVWLASACVDADIESARVYTLDVDPRGGEPEKNFAAAGVTGLVERVVADSRVWTPPVPIDFLFLDALHDFDFVRAEWAHLAPFLAASGALVAVHDTANSPSGAATDAVLADLGSRAIGRIRLRTNRGLDIIQVGAAS